MFKKGKQFIFNDDITINYETKGKGKTDIIFLHGFGASLRTWDDIINFFPEDKYKMYLIDLMGYGFSSKPEKEFYTLDRQAEIVLSFIQEMELKDFILIGHSYGGGTALMIQLKIMDMKPDLKVEKMILIDNAAYSKDIPFFINLLRMPVIQDVLLDIFSGHTMAEIILKSICYNKKEIDSVRIERYSYFLEMEGIKNVLIETAENIIPSDYVHFVNRYKEIKTPVLIIWGENDPVLGLTNGIKLHNELPDNKIRILDKCGHIPFEEYPEKTFDSMIKFLEE